MGAVLLVAYYVPPAGGPAVQRNLQFIEYLSEEGWAPEVLTVKEGAYPNRDPDLLDQLPASVPVHRTGALDPLALYAKLKGGSMPAGSMGGDDSWLSRAAKWIRANVFIPDARVGWWPYAVWTGRRLLETGRFDAVLTTGAPHSVHLIGRTLHADSGIPWVADLHDPWTDISYYDEFPHTDWARRLDASLEVGVLREASAVTTVSPSWADLFSSKASNQYHVIENGFDRAEFEGVASANASEDPSPDDATFTLAHVGKLYASRNPTAVWDAVASLRDEEAIPHLRIRLIGTVDPDVRAAIDAHDLGGIVDEVGFVPHAEAIREMARSTLLLLVIEPFAQAKGMITSKLYEYLASGRPVLGVGPAGGDADALMRTHEAGEVVAWNDARRAREVIRAHYDAWADGTPTSGASLDALGNHTRRHQARRMAAVLSDVASGASER